MKIQYIIPIAAVVAVGVFVYHSHSEVTGGSAVTSTADVSAIKGGGASADAANTGNQSTQKATSHAAIKKAAHLKTDPPLIQDLAANFQVLKARAENGDADMAFSLANTLFACNTRVADQVEQNCKNVSQKEINEYPRLLDMAASQGNVGAQLAYAPMMAQYMAQDESLMSDESAMRSYKYKTLSYLHSAAAQGSVDALNQLAIVYQSGHIVDRDPVLAYAYMYATYKTGLVPNSSKVLSTWSQGLTPSQISNGAREGEDIFSSCCNAN